MSKITSKNLHYDSTLPPFLARLQANNGSHDGRHEFAAARPRKARNPEDEAEDEPVYFDEDTKHTFTKSEWEETQKVEDAEKRRLNTDGEATDEGEGKAGSNREKSTKERIVDIGVSRKRKAGKVIGGEEDTAKTIDSSPIVEKLSNPTTNKVHAKPKEAKKGKKIKLSFGDE